VYYPPFVREAAMNNEQPFHLVAWAKKGSSFRYGVNSSDCSTKFKRKYRDGQTGYHLHAEMALLKKSKEGDIDTIHVIRFKKNGNVTMAKPCLYCQKFLRQYGVKKVYYTNWNGEWDTLKL
jgi:deoxycytidylate deaminase|tara:strand:- start:2957 stop:3319 length:363 start_codon:yes stop_codon:yes gene_type:complete